MTQRGQRHVSANELSGDAISAIDNIGSVVHDDHLRRGANVFARARTTPGAEKNQACFVSCFLLCVGTKGAGCGENARAGSYPKKFAAGVVLTSRAAHRHFAMQTLFVSGKTPAFPKPAGNRC